MPSTATVSWERPESQGPDEQRKQAYHPRFRSCGDARKDGKQHTETASDLPGAGHIGPANAIRKPRWHQVSGRLYVHDMGQPNRYERNCEEDPCDAEAVLPRGEGQG